VITSQDWHETAEREAAKVYGRKHATFYSVRRYSPLWAALIGLGLLGYGVWWTWQHATAALGSAHLSAPAGPGVPTWTWVAMAVLLVLTLVAFRPGRIDRLSVLIVKFLVFGATWLFLIGFTVQAALG
jgi:hypothetical protein